MRSIVGISFVLTACFTSPAEDGVGPRPGTWKMDPDPVRDWYCVRGGASPCEAPAYFSPMPAEVAIRRGGILHWSGGLQHTGAVDGACIRVPAATEQGVARTDVTFCNLIEGGVVDELHAFVIIGWSPGTPDECTCSAHFGYHGGE